ncbi:hypothetical protein K466DRAFT_579220 [Polyporus arcularius HHB13444]|uniref:CxC2-like cysteine cluster KDZ transposase-associated domain-containing protein n=1 Tax=Polyporus arcularius HHB13444 TaxID=1314778 RepID=A0A5C3P0P1_9APHY|nr:hypothetical protein K466DRAFT_579220 [Polyporus arcularius HHB13444]
MKPLRPRDENAASKSKARTEQAGDQKSPPKEWADRFDSLLADMLTWEAPSETIHTCRCGSGRNAQYRCVQCDCSHLRCKYCMKTAHKNAWFHYIEAWEDEKYFKRYDLISLGFVIHLGHEGQPCPHLSASRSPSRITIAHSNGVHECNLQYCHCPDAPEQVSQLVQARIFPASLDRVRNAFTLSLLRMWHQLWLCAKISTNHFMRALARYTDNAFPHEVKDRNRQFRTVSRVFAYLQMVKRSGKHLGIVIPGRDPKDITVGCVACPKPRFNLPANWREAPFHLRPIFRDVQGMDGNAALQKRAKKDDPEDLAFAFRQAFFGDHTEMADMVAESYEEDKDTPTMTCSGFKVGRSQRPGKFRFVDTSGIIAITCRHIFFRSGTVVDMITGERSCSSMA